jgi:hypothetical protein
MRKWLAWLIILGGLYYIGHNYGDEIIRYGLKYIIEHKTVVVPTSNEYKKDYDFLFIQNTNDFEPKDKQDLLNIYYTIINSGWNEFTFYCTKVYPTCIDDVKIIANDQALLSNLNNFVHPYNSYSEIKTRYDSLGTITINTTKTYNNQTKVAVDNKIDEIINNITNNTMTMDQKIKIIHDYIINTTKYDSERLNTNIAKYRSDTSYGVLFEGYGFCSGYADTMAIFLSKLGIRNIKVASERHIWNLVYLNNKWYHIDVSWDDPVSEDGKDILDYTFYLIDTKKLLEVDIKEHNFPKNIYLEAQ